MSAIYDTYEIRQPRHLGLWLSIVIVVLMITALFVTAAVLAIQGDIGASHTTPPPVSEQIALSD